MSRRLLVVALAAGLVFSASPGATPKSPSFKRPTKSRIMTNQKTQLVLVKERVFNVTAYSAPCPIQGTGMRTRNGTRVIDKHGRKVPGCAADPKIIPISGKKHRYYVKIKGRLYPVDDTGGAIRGHKLDLRLSSRHEAMKFGRKKLRVQVYKEIVYANRR